MGHITVCSDCIPCILRLNLMKLPPLQHTGISEVTYPHIRYISSRITGFGRNYEVSTVCKCISLRTVGWKHEYELLFHSSRLSVTINFKMAWLFSAWLSIIVILSWRQCWFVFIENARWNRMNAAVAGKRREMVFWWKFVQGKFLAFNKQCRVIKETDEPKSDSLRPVAHLHIGP